MSEMTFVEKVRNRQREANTMVCAGLDVDLSLIPEKILIDHSTTYQRSLYFNVDIIDATVDWVCAYKPNIAFYEGLGLEGLEALLHTIDYIHIKEPDVPVILDAKRADIANSNKGYVLSAFEEFKADAITVNPYLGQEALQPFLDRADKGIIVLCRTSNEGAEFIQNLSIPLINLPKEAREFFTSLENFVEIDKSGGAAVRLYQWVAYRVATTWNQNGNCLLVVGATYPEELKKVRQIVGDMPILVPGVGAQSGDLEEVIKNGLDSTGDGLIISASRSILYASGGEDFAEAARREAKKLRNQINQIKFSLGR